MCFVYIHTHSNCNCPAKFTFIENRKCVQSHRAQSTTNTGFVSSLGWFKRTMVLPALQRHFALSHVFLWGKVLGVYIHNEVDVRRQEEAREMQIKMNEDIFKSLFSNCLVQCSQLLRMQ